MRSALVKVPTAKEWAEGDAPEEKPEELAPAADPKPPVDVVSVVIGVKHNPMKFGKARGAARAGRAGSSRAWAKGKARAKK